MPHRKSNHNRRGTALSLAIMVSVVITGLVMAMAWSAGIQASMATGVTHMDGAMDYAAEAGLQKVAWYCKNNKMASITSPLTGSINGYAYSATWATVSGSTIRISSRASLGNVAYTCYLTATPPLGGAAAIASGGNFDNKNIDITGNVAVNGNYTNGGSGSLTGNLTYSGTATGTGSVTGSITKAASPTVDMTALGATLEASAGQTYTGAQSGVNFRFDLLPGSNKVIYVNGNVTNPTFVGSGTLYVKGTVSVGGFGTSTNPVNIVATGDVTSSNNITVYGNLYVGGAWSGGKLSWSGLLYVAGAFSRSNNGSSSITMAAVPWFDPRGGSGGSHASFTNFAGPMP